MFAHIGKTLVTAALLWAVVCWFTWEMSGRNKCIDYVVQVDALPADDSNLTTWFREQSDAVEASVVRKGDTIAIHFLSAGSGMEAPMPPLPELGYEVAALHYTVTNPHRVSYGFLDVHSSPWRFAALGLCLTVGFVVSLLTDRPPKQGRSAANDSNDDESPP
jgi:hypothetical protein